VSPWRRRLFFLWNFYPPFLGAGVRITKLDPELRFIEVKLTRSWRNTNYVGTLFGGAMFTMADPFHMVLLIERLGTDYIVRDKGAEIRYLKKGTESVYARFELADSLLEEIRACKEEVQERKIPVAIKTANGEIIAEVVKTLHIRRKSPPIK
jgi:acyl-coenzyme A thioesterase PaaI-like protein